MNIVTGDTVASIYRKLLDDIILHGDRVRVRGQLTKELLNVHIELRNPRANVLFHPQRNLNYRFMVAEWLWVTFGQEDVATIAQYNQKIADYSDDGRRFFGAYGPRLVGQLDYVWRALRAENSRQAVLTLWRINPPATKDVPCTLTMQFLARHQRLHLTVNMRSSDIWLGLPYDIFNFTQIQNALAGHLGLELGIFNLSLGSSHLYEAQFKLADELTRRPYEFGQALSPCLPGWPGECLATVLQHPEDDCLIDPPWDRYARALQVKTRQAAWEVLDAPVHP